MAESLVRPDGATCLGPYWASDGFSPYTSLMDLSTDLSMYSMFILYESNDIRSMMASARVLSPSHIWLYQSLSSNWEQNMVDDFLRLLWITSSNNFASSSLSLYSSHSSMMRSVGLVYFCSAFSRACRSSAADNCGEAYTKALKEKKVYG